jgi:hypothetical protein
MGRANVGRYIDSKNVHSLSNMIKCMLRNTCLSMIHAKKNIDREVASKMDEVLECC